MQKIIDDICEGKPLDKRYDDHPMVKTSPKHYQGYRIFHYKGNICVIYKIHSDTVELLRIGNHSDLGLTENYNKI